MLHQRSLEISLPHVVDTGHDHNMLLRAEDHAFVPLCALNLHTHFYPSFFFTLIYYMMIVVDVIVFLFCFVLI